MALIKVSEQPDPNDPKITIGTYKVVPCGRIPEGDPVAAEELLIPTICLLTDAAKAVVKALRSKGWVKKGNLLSRQRGQGKIETIDLDTATYHRPEIHNYAGETSKWESAEAMIQWFGAMMWRKMSRRMIAPKPIESVRHHWRDTQYGTTYPGKAYFDSSYPQSAGRNFGGCRGRPKQFTLGPTRLGEWPFEG
jgi:hypothetical protein